MSLAAAAALLPAFEARPPQTTADWEALADLMLRTAEDIAADAETTGGESTICTPEQFDELLAHIETVQAKTGEVVRS